YHPGSAHDSDAGIAKRLRRRAERSERIGVEPPRQGPLTLWQLRVSHEVRSCSSLAADIEHRRPGERGRQGEAALHDVNAVHLPPAQQKVHGAIPVLPEPAAMAKRQFPDIAGNQTVGDVELRRPSLGAQVISVLRFAEYA